MRQLFLSQFAFGGLAPAVPSRPILCVVFALGLLLGIEGCGRRLQQAQVIPGPPRALAELWQYDEQHATRYINKIKQKIAQGLALTALPAS